MGYTHYWRTTANFDDKEWGMIMTMVSYLIRNNGSTVGIRDWDGRGEPQVGFEEIRFNGDASQGLDHETFTLRKHRQGRENTPWISPEDYEREGEFNFTKTAHKPYDLYVIHSLAIAKIIAPDKIHLSSDGGDDVFPLAFYEQKLQDWKKIPAEELPIFHWGG